MEFVDIPTERTTAITDIILAWLALGCIIYLRRIGQDNLWKTNLWSWAFGFVMVAAILGAIAHGVKMSKDIQRLLWQPLNLCLGLTVALFVVGVIYDWRGMIAARQSLPLMMITGLVFFGVTRFISGSFLVFIIYELTAMLFALLIYSWLAVTGQLAGATFMALGVFITVIAAGIQAGETASLTLIWQFDHNGLFHLVQMVGIIFLMAGLRAAY